MNKIISNISEIVDLVVEFIFFLLIASIARGGWKGRGVSSYIKNSLDNVFTIKTKEITPGFNSKRIEKQILHKPNESKLPVLKLTS